MLLDNPCKNYELGYSKIHWLPWQLFSSILLESNTSENLKVSRTSEYFLFFLLEVCRAASLCGGDGAVGTVRGCVRPTENFTSTVHHKQLWPSKLFFFPSVSWLTLIAFNARALLESPRRPLCCRFSSSMDSFGLRWGPRYRRQEYPTDAHFSRRCWILLPDLHFYPSTKLPTEWNTVCRESVAWTNMHISISPLWCGLLSWTIAPSGQK